MRRTLDRKLLEDLNSQAYLAVYLELLRLPMSSPAVTIESNYRSLIQCYLPDKNPSNADLATQVSARLHVIKEEFQTQKLGVIRVRAHLGERKFHEICNLRKIAELQETLWWRSLPPELEKILSEIPSDTATKDSVEMLLGKIGKIRKILSGIPSDTDPTKIVEKSTCQQSYEFLYIKCELTGKKTDPKGGSVYYRTEALSEQIENVNFSGTSFAPGSTFYWCLFPNTAKFTRADLRNARFPQTKIAFDCADALFSMETILSAERFMLGDGDLFHLQCTPPTTWTETYNKNYVNEAPLRFVEINDDLQQSKDPVIYTTASKFLQKIKDLYPACRSTTGLRLFGKMRIDMLEQETNKKYGEDVRKSDVLKAMIHYAMQNPKSATAKAFYLAYEEIYKESQVPYTNNYLNEPASTATLK